MSCIRTVIFYLLFSLLCVFSCKTTGALSLDEVWLTDNKKFTLLLSEDIESPFDCQQIISASYQGQVYRFIAWVKADPTGLYMAFINDLGAGIGELTYKKSEVSFSSSIIPNSIKPQYIIADFQLCYYKAQPLKLSLEKNGLTFEDTGNKRRVMDKNTVIIEIEKNQSSVKLVNFARNYSYTIEGDFK